MNAENPDQEIDNPNLKHVRLYGIVVLLIGMTMLWMFMFNPISLAKEGLEEITIYRKLAMAGMAFFGFGSIMVILGKNSLKMIPDTNANLSDVPLICWMTILSISGIGIYVWFWFEGQLKLLGYQ